MNKLIDEWWVYEYYCSNYYIFSIYRSYHSPLYSLYKICIRYRSYNFGYSLPSWSKFHFKQIFSYSISIHPLWTTLWVYIIIKQPTNKLIIYKKTIPISRTFIGWSVFFSLELYLIIEQLTGINILKYRIIHK